jgi:predicted anti-sigma-YlaC factor YlaD
MLTCKEVSRLVSDSLDRRLPFGQRVGVRLHLLMCNMCRAYRRQILILRDVIHLYARDEAQAGRPDTQLSDEARTRIRKTLRGEDQ